MKTIVDTHPVVKCDYKIENKKSNIAVLTLENYISPIPEANL